jgi:carbonic anhydrase
VITAKEALERLRSGNQRFANETGLPHKRAEEAHPSDVAQSQEPFAIILGCSDSRVPAEIVFDQTLGDLFVIRVAGNVLAPSLVGSIEFAAEKFGTELVIVLGHSSCGAVQETMDIIDGHREVESPNLHAVIDQIVPVIEELQGNHPDSDRETILESAIRANVCASVDGLLAMSPILTKRVQAGKLVIVGAEYHLETGAVDFFHGVPTQ